MPKTDGPFIFTAQSKKNNPNTTNILVMGPWCHGCWSRAMATSWAIAFQCKTLAFFREQIQFPFFMHT